MPFSIAILDVPDETMEELAARAAATGRSFQEYVRAHLIRIASQPDAEALMAGVAQRTQSTGSRLPAATILRLRDEDRR